jgi:hypothetical protein
MECDRESVTVAALTAIIVAGADCAFTTVIQPRDT